MNTPLVIFVAFVLMLGMAHSMQARFNEHDPRLYNANRDVAHNFRFVAETVAQRLSQRSWDAEKKAIGIVPDDDMAVACVAFIRFVGDIRNVGMEEALADSGFLNVSSAAQIAYMANLGAVVTGIYFAGIREATLGGEATGKMDELVAAGRQCSELLHMPRWRRLVWKLIQKIKKAKNAFNTKPTDTGQ